MRKEEKEFIKHIKLKYNEPVTLVDIGANLGNYSNYFNDNITTKKTYLIEPIKSCFDKIVERENYQKFNIGLGSYKGESVFYEAVGKESHSSIVNRKWLYDTADYNITKKNIKIDTLDNLLDEKINVLKIDTEGFELEVLKGSKRLLEEGKIDYIQFEYGGCFKDNNLKLNDVIEYLNQYGYGVYDLVSNKFKQIDKYIDDYKWINFFAMKKTNSL